MNPTHAGAAQAARHAPLRLGRRARTLAVERELDTQLDAVRIEDLCAEIVRRVLHMRCRAHANATLLEGLPAQVRHDRRSSFRGGRRVVDAGAPA